jgi:hypothetical protein
VSALVITPVMPRKGLARLRREGARIVSAPATIVDRKSDYMSRSEEATWLNIRNREYSHLDWSRGTVRTRKADEP